jgi:hypothetical protein
LRPADLSAPSADYRLIFAPLPLIRFGARTAVVLGRFIDCLGRLPPDSSRFLQCHQRSALSRITFGSSLNRTELEMMNPLFGQVGETKYHIHEYLAKWAHFYVFDSI